MKKRAWEKVRIKQGKVWIVLILLMSLMGISYGAWSDQVRLTGKVTLASKPPPPEYKIVGDIMVAEAWPYSIWAGGKVCLHMDEGNACPSKGCDYIQSGKGLTMRYVVTNDTTKTMTLLGSGMTGEAEVVLLYKKNQLGQGKEYRMTMGLGATNHQIVKKDGVYTSGEMAGYDINIPPKSTYVIETNICNFMATFNDKLTNSPAAWPEKLFGKYNPQTVSKEFKAIASMTLQIKYKLGGTLQKDPLTREIQNQVLSVSPAYYRSFASVFQTTPSAIIITLPEVVTPPAITLPEVTTSSNLEVQVLPYD